MNAIARDEERWLSISHEIYLHKELNDLKARRNRLLNRPRDYVTTLALIAIEDVIGEVANEYWLVLNYNRAKGWLY